MNERVRSLLNRLDLNGDGKVSIEDAAKAYELVDGEVKPHGWLWTLGVACLFIVIGFGLGRCS